MSDFLKKIEKESNNVAVNLEYLFKIGNATRVIGLSDLSDKLYYIGKQIMNSTAEIDKAITEDINDRVREQQKSFADVLSTVLNMGKD